VYHLSIWLAFGAGILSFVSPCTLPLFPTYLGYISGVSYTSLSTGERGVRLRAFLHALCFCLGLSLLFVLLGMGATAFGRLLRPYLPWVRLVGGALVVCMGLFLAGVLKSGWLMKERRFLPATKPVGYFGSFFIGVAFAAGWTPCIGPILGSVLALAMANPSAGTAYIAAYATGFCLPFLVLAVTLTSVRPLLKYTHRIAQVGGWLLVFMGLLLMADKLTWLTIWLQNATGYTGF
jgi:cytochrome c-type biogenesis protein